MGMFLLQIVSVSSTATAVEENKLYCDGVNNQSYTCESGHCCGQSQCCSYYYELWWFWLVWAVIFILSCCCICHHRRTKHRLQQQQRQHEINLIAYREAHNYSSLPFYFRFLPNYLLPEYEEVVNHPPTPPPPYSALNSSQTAASSPLTPEHLDGLQLPSQSTAHPPSGDAHPSHHSVEECTFPTDYIQKEESKAQLAPGSGRPELPEVSVRESPCPEKQGGDCCKELLKDTEYWKEEEEQEGVEEGRMAGRHRRFTGDSGIEVCVCSPVQEREALQELGELLGDHPEAPADFCDDCASCGRHASFRDEGQGQPTAERRAESQAQPPSCVLLHTISEQEGPN
ncbi:WW domain binding protein 1-like b [Paramormyrops kingsleyae]|uniref:WW domain binding protein 1-like b n=1 Tax=Paramormyrops kingsleyae TaxID=1676925 RepID=UPI000CD6089F|nr:WW domain binding protein 1-like [Paramormyrops kingsleyae]